MHAREVDMVPPTMDYSELPEDIILKIAGEHLSTVTQHIAFSAVCKSWRSSALQPKRRRRHHLQPCLPGLLVSQTSNYFSGPTHDFFPLPTVLTSHLSSYAPAKLPPLTLHDFFFFPHDPSPPTTLPRLNLPHFPSPEAGPTVESKHYLTSKDGWVLLLRPGTPAWPLHLYLLNPVTNSTVPLPPLHVLPHNILSYSTVSPQPLHARPHIQRAVLSSSPDCDDGDKEDCYVFIMLRPDPQCKTILAWCKAEASNNDDHWEITSLATLLGSDCEPRDATYVGGKLYVVDYYDNVLHVISNLTTTTAAAAAARSLPTISWIVCSNCGGEQYVWASHLTDLRGELLLILRTVCCTTGCSVHKLALGGESAGRDDHVKNLERELASLPGSYHWEEVSNLDGYAVFIGSHQAFTFPANCEDDPVSGKNGVRSNHIYFVSKWHNDCGVYDLDGKRFRMFGHRRIIRSFWFQPMPRDCLEHEKDEEVILEDDLQAGNEYLLDTTRDDDEDDDGDRNHNVTQRDYRFLPKARRRCSDDYLDYYVEGIITDDEDEREILAADANDDYYDYLEPLITAASKRYGKKSRKNQSKKNKKVRDTRFTATYSIGFVGPF